MRESGGMSIMSLKTLRVPGGRVYIAYDLHTEEHLVSPVVLDGDEPDPETYERFWWPALATAWAVRNALVYLENMKGALPA